MQSNFVMYAVSFVVLVICNFVQSQAGVVNIQPGSNPGVSGQLLLLYTASGGAVIRGQISGLTPGIHGFHIHEKGALGNACKDAGPHFNPFQKLHGGPDHDVRHVGDLGNIEADQFGVANIDFADHLISLDPSSPAYIGNRTIVVHAKPDDVGLGGNEESKKTGNAGERVGCGIIQLGIFQQPSPQHGNQAIVTIIPGSSPNVHGNLEVQEVQRGIIISGRISGLTPGPHGFHIHEKGDLSDQCKAALGHFNPFALTHGDPQDYQSRHVGDLGNIWADSHGVARINIFDPLASFDPSNQAFVGNRAMVVHSKPDDFGRGGDADSKKTGNAGSRVGCGIIEIQEQGESANFFPDLGLHQER